MKNKETIPGFDITTRPLTDEEKSRDITVERIRDFHYEVGEDLLDVTNIGYGKQSLIFGGWLLHKYPELSDEILKKMNELKTFDGIINGDFLMYNDINGLGYDEKEDIDKLYFDFCEFVNQTKNTKETVNEILIIIDEYYNPKT